MEKTNLYKAVRPYMRHWVKKCGDDRDFVLKLILDVWKKLPDDFRKDPNLRVSLGLEHFAGGMASMRFSDGEVPERYLASRAKNTHVEGMTCLTGIIYSRYKTITLSARFISHPFWQLVTHGGRDVAAAMRGIGT